MLKEGALKLGVPLNNSQISAFETFYELLIEWNKKFNLTRITDKNDVIIKHFLDGLTLTDLIPKNATVADIGAGAGFPSIPLAIALPSCQFILMEALQKRVNFLNEAIRILGLTNITPLHIRAEDAAKGEYGGKFDVCTARAVAKLDVLAKYMLPLLKTGGVVLAMKGKNVDDELNSAQPAIKKHNGKNPEIILKNLPFSDITHSIIKITKGQ